MKHPKLSRLRREQRMEMMKRRIQVNKRYVDGQTMQEIATALGTSVSTISTDLKAIEEQLLKQAGKSTKIKRAKRVKQLEVIAQMALSSFERSRQDEEEVRTTTSMEMCSECKGKQLEEPCIKCGGEGKVPVEIITRKIKGQAGDPAHLTVAQKSIVEAAKLEGLQPKRKPGPKKVEPHLHLHQEKTENKYIGADPKLLIKAMAAIADLRDSTEGKTIDVEPEKEEK